MTGPSASRLIRAAAVVLALVTAGPMTTASAGPEPHDGSRPVATSSPIVGKGPATGPTSAGTDRRPQLGVQFHGLWQTYDDRERRVVLDRLAAMGARWVRIDLSWAMLQAEGPAPSAWGVAQTDRVISMAHRRGLKVLGTLWLTPSWARPAAGERSLPADPRHYARALTWAARRWAGEVQAWEVWNEPNTEDFLAGADPAAYTRLLCTTQRTLRVAVPQRRGPRGVRLVFGGTMYNDADWIARAYAAGARGCFDVLATHPYVGPSDRGPWRSRGGNRWDLDSLADVRRVMRAHGDRRPVWATEFGWSSHPDRGGEPSWERGVSETTQARHTVAALRLMQRRHPWLTHAFVYTERDTESGNAHQDGFGVLRRDLSRKPVYCELARWAGRPRAC